MGMQNVYKIAILTQGTMDEVNLVFLKTSTGSGESKIFVGSLAYFWSLEGY